MGGRTVAQAVVSRPDLFRCAILEDPPWWEAPPDATRRPQFDYATMSVEEIAAAGREQNPGWHEDEFAAWAESKKQFRPSAGWLKGVPGMGSEWRRLAAGITIPALLICGETERGAIVSRAVADEATSLSPSLESVALEAGHNVRRETFDAFVEAVTGFLGRNSSA
jgi:pimeloyl-ACP methyl ester carboxylesterase